jgi:hypothetical protein
MTHACCDRLRSLYHCDGHEKMAKVYGIWVHGGIDGYSRFVLYMKATANKYPETVRDCYVAACNKYGWSRRTRWDKGTHSCMLIGHDDLHLYA